MEKEIKTVDDFKAFVAEVEAKPGYRRPLAFGIGICRKAGPHSTTYGLVDARFPFPNFNENFGAAAVLAHAVGHDAGTSTYPIDVHTYEDIMDCFAVFHNDGNKHANIEVLKTFRKVLGKVSNEYELVVSFIDQPEHDTGPHSMPDAYLRLHLLSHRKVRPNEIKLDGIFDVLPIVAHTSEGPMLLQDLEKRKFELLENGITLHVHSVDRFPPMLDYVVPSGVRIADASRVRLGAYLGEGTTVMHEGFVNFNAGTLGKSMVEGRISQGVVIGDQTDIGGGASIMGTLSGGGKEKIRIGRGCLIGANAGTGISLGDKCVVEAGLYLTAGMPILYKGTTVKAETLSGLSGLTFRRNGTDGKVEALEIENKVELNEVLHVNKAA